MTSWIRKNASVLVAAVLASALTAGGPSLAAAAFDALNADKVDGKHAVGSGASKAKRRNKLVATNRQGVLPNNILNKALDADKLDGADSQAYQRDYAQTKVVAKSGGDFTSVVAALNSITDASANKRYLVAIAPGTYTGHVIMKPFVDLVGSGREITTLSCACGQATNFDPGPSGPAAVHGASDATLAHLTVNNTGGGAAAEALAAFAVNDFRVNDVRLTATSTHFMWGGFFEDVEIDFQDVVIELEGVTDDALAGIETRGNSTVRLADSSITATGATYNVGYNNQAGTLIARDTDVRVAAAPLGTGTGISNAASGSIDLAGMDIDSSGIGDLYVGVDNSNGSARIADSQIVASGAAATSVARGIVNLGFAETSLDVIGTTVIADGAGSGTGIFINANFVGVFTSVVGSWIQANAVGLNTGVRQDGSTGGTLTVDSSRVSAASATLVRVVGTVRTGGTALAGGPVSGTVTCANVWDENYTFLDSTCP